MTQHPLVSVIVRTKNEKYWIGKCLHAIQNQKYKNIEIIVVDNLSTDKTIQIIKTNFPQFLHLSKETGLKPLINLRQISIYTQISDNGLVFHAVPFE